jgi:hypothetical protein
MRNITGQIFIMLTIAACCCSPVAAQEAKRKLETARTEYQFESEPRAVLKEGGVETSRHARLYLRASNLYMLAVTGGRDGSHLTLSVSNDGGDSFEPLVMISEPGASVSSHGENSPTLAINGIEFYALWEQNNEHGGTDLMFARSLRFGRKFDKPVRVTDKEKPSSNAFSYLGVAPNGDLYAVWLDGRDPKNTMPGTSHVYLAKSTDKGATWSKNVPIAKNVCPCCRPTLAFGAQGEVFVAWRGVVEGDIRDIWLATSTDNGATFTQPVRVAADNWKISGCPHSGASMAVKGKRLYVAWHSEGDGTNAGIRLAWSDDGGKSFARAAIVSGAIVDTNHPMLSMSEDGRLLMVFKGRDPRAKQSWGPIGAYLVEIGDNGMASAPVAVPGNRKSISYPAIAAGTVGRVWIAWTEAGEKGANVLFTRARRTAHQARVKDEAAIREEGIFARHKVE